MDRRNDAAGECLTKKHLQLVTTLHRLWIEHVMWTRSFMVSTASGFGDLGDVTKRLLRNPADFADALRPLYGDQKAERLKQLFTDHLLIAAALVNAAKAGDARAADEQRRKWYANADDIAAFLGAINLYWSQAGWRTMLYDHLGMTENEAVQLLNGQYAASIEQYDAIQTQALKMADETARGIGLQFNI